MQQFFRGFNRESIASHIKVSRYGDYGHFIIILPTHSSKLLPSTPSTSRFIAIHFHTYTNKSTLLQRYNHQVIKKNRFLPNITANPCISSSPINADTYTTHPVNPKPIFPKAIVQYDIPFLRFATARRDLLYRGVEITDIPRLDVLLGCLLIATEGRVLDLFRGWEESLELERSLLLRDGYVRRLIPR